MATDVLSILSMFAEPERAFFGGKNTVFDKSASLNSDMINVLEYCMSMQRAEALHRCRISAAMAKELEIIQEYRTVGFTSVVGGYRKCSVLQKCFIVWCRCEQILQPEPGRANQSAIYLTPCICLIGLEAGCQRHNPFM